MSKIHSPVRGLKKNIVRRLLRYVRPYRARVAFILLTSVLYVAFVLLGPVLYGEAIDAMLGAGQVDFSTVYFMTAGFALCVLLAFLCDAYDEETDEKGDTRTVLRLHPALAPYKAAVLPLSKKLADGASEIFRDLAFDFMVDYDDAGSIGKRYRRQDEIGTPICITYDFDSVEDGCVTVRDRDTMEQQRIPVASLKEYIAGKIRF